MSEKERRRAPGILESEVMGVLWARGEPLTATEVQSALGGDLAYTTVQTILIRLHEKNLGYGRRRAAVTSTGRSRTLRQQPRHGCAPPGRSA
jgi:hypothetical protein